MFPFDDVIMIYVQVPEYMLVFRVWLWQNNNEMCRSLLLCEAVLVCALQEVLTSSYNCQGCGLNNIPTNIPTGTTVLYLHNNRITYIDRISVQALTSIQRLYVGNNMVTAVEYGAFIGLNIQSLFLESNRLRTIPHVEPLAYSLFDLYLRGNRITTIEPYTFKNFTRLSRLILSSNLITSLNDFALYIPGPTLYHVEINNNKIETIARYAFSKMSTTALYLNQNELDEFPCLYDTRRVVELSLRYNKISAVPTGCGQWWGQLKLLDIFENPITSINNITSHTHMLEKLVSSKPLVLSDETFNGTEHLREIEMSNINEFPAFHSSRATLQRIELSGEDIRCINKEQLDGMNAVQILKLRSTSIVRLPDSRCSTNTNENQILLGYFRSLYILVVHVSKLESIPDVHNANQLHTLDIMHANMTTVDVSQIAQLKDVHVWRLSESELSHFPNLTALGNGSKLSILDLSRNRIPSFPCFPGTFKLNYLTEIHLIDNVIDFICNMDFAPNVTRLFLSENHLTSVLFLDYAKASLTKLDVFVANYNDIESFSDSALLVIPNCRELKIEVNRMKLFPNIKFIAGSIVRIELKQNVIPEVPCSALGIMEQLAYLDLTSNQITYICPRLLGLAAKLTYLNLEGNLLVEIGDLRSPGRLQPTCHVMLEHNPWQCLVSLCWMLFVPHDSYLKLSAHVLGCRDPSYRWIDLTIGLTAECTSKTNTKDPF